MSTIKVDLSEWQEYQFQADCVLSNVPPPPPTQLHSLLWHFAPSETDSDSPRFVRTWNRIYILISPFQNHPSAEKCTQFFFSPPPQRSIDCQNALYAISNGNDLIWENYFNFTCLTSWENTLDHAFAAARCLAKCLSHLASLRRRAAACHPLFYTRRPFHDRNPCVVTDTEHDRCSLLLKKN